MHPNAHANKVIDPKNWWYRHDIIIEYLVVLFKYQWPAVISRISHGLAKPSQVNVDNGSTSSRKSGREPTYLWYSSVHLILVSGLHPSSWLHCVAHACVVLVKWQQFITMCWAVTHLSPLNYLGLASSTLKHAWAFHRNIRYLHRIPGV